MTGMTSCACALAHVSGPCHALHMDKITVTEAAKRLGISRRAILGRIERGTLPAEKIGDGRTSAYLIHEDDLETQASLTA